MKALIKLAIVALLANATWHLWGVYSAHFKFKDAAQSAMQYNTEKTEQEQRARILELAEQYDLPVTDANFTVRRQDNHVIAEGSYTRPVELLPGFTYPMKFNWNVDVISMGIRR
jgi:hypothetical protein